MSRRLRVALTFDAEHPDRPADAGATEGVITALADAGVRATFFVQGRWVEAFPTVARSIVHGGHLVGNHSHYHARMPLLSRDGFRTDVRAAESIIRRRMGVDPRPFFRLPFGSGSRHPTIHAWLDDLGYRHVHWSFEVKEWRTRARAREIEDGIVDGVLDHGDGAVVLLHPWPSVVPQAVPGILERLGARGAEFVDLRELDTLPDGRDSGSSSHAAGAMTRRAGAPGSDSP